MTMSTLARIATDWAVRCFGRQHIENLPLRGLRHAEEAIELAQALGTPRDLMVKLVDQVYSRPVGERVQELGGSLLTACILAETIGIAPEAAFERELTRVLAKSPESFANRNRAKMDTAPIKVNSMREVARDTVMVVYEDGTKQFMTKLEALNKYGHGRLIGLGPQTGATPNV